MDILQELVRTYGACATQTMLSEVIHEEQKYLASRMKDINLYMSGQVEVGTLEQIESKISSVEEQLSKAAPSSKATQRAAEAAKRMALEAAGESPRDKLTKESLEKWLKEGKSFSQIAREEVGLRQEEVSAAAKKYNLKPLKQTTKHEQSVTVTKEGKTE